MQYLYFNSSVSYLLRDFVFFLQYWSFIYQNHNTTVIFTGDENNAGASYWPEKG